MLQYLHPFRKEEEEEDYKLWPVKRCIMLGQGTRTIALPNAWLVDLRDHPRNTRAICGPHSPTCSFWKFATRDVKAPPSQTPLVASMNVTLGLSSLLVTSKVQHRKDCNAPQCSRHPNVQTSAPDASTAAEHSCQLGWLSGLACACIALAPAPAGAYNVRLEDVENPALQSGELINVSQHQATTFSS